MGQIQLVTSRLLEIGSKPDKKQSASFEFNKIIPFCTPIYTKNLGLGFPNAWVPVGTELTNHEIQKWFQHQISRDLTMEVDGEQRRLRNRACRSVAYRCKYRCISATATMDDYNAYN